MTGRYKAYTEYRKPMIEWMHDVPSHWHNVPLKYMAIENNSLFVDGDWIESKDIANEGIRYITTGNVGEGIYKEQGAGFISDETFNKLVCTEVFEGDLLLSRLNAPIGRACMVPNLSARIVTSVDNVIFRPDPQYHKQFLVYLFSSASYFKHTSNLARGATMQRISRGLLGNIRVVVPPLSEQQIIANFLDHETAKIDTLIAKQEKLIELLKEKRQAVISHAVTKGLNPDAPMKDSGVEWLGDVPEHWAVMRLKHLIKSLESGCSVNAADIPANKNELGVLKTSCVYTRRFRASENKTVVKEDLSRVKCPVRKGAIIISRMNTPELVGASALVDTEANNLFLPDRLWQTIFNEQLEVNPEFLAYFMTVEGFRNQISLSAEGASSSMQNIAKEDYLAINALLPQLKEQAEIVSYIKENEAKFLRLEVQAMNAIELMKERKTALISAAVTGKIDVRAWRLKGD